MFNPDHPAELSPQILAATLWLMTRYSMTRCPRLAALTVKHLQALAGLPNHEIGAQLSTDLRHLEATWMELTT